LDLSTTKQGDPLRAAPAADEVAERISRQLAHGRYAPSELYGDGRVARRIAAALVNLTPFVQKRLHYIYDLPKAGGVAVRGGYASR